jgi:hypothetical protein
MVGDHLYIWSASDNMFKDAGTIRGPQGIQGTKGNTGNTGATPTIKGQVESVSQLPATGTIGDLYLLTNGDLYQ